MSSAAELEALARKLRYDLTAAQGKLSDLLKGIADLAAQLPENETKAQPCPQCGLHFNRSPAGRDRLRTHLVNVHGATDPLTAKRLPQQSRPKEG